MRVDIGLKPKNLLGGDPDLPLKGVRALIDTGAGSECIDDELARSLNLPITDEGEISGVGGKHHGYVYTARVWVPELNRLLFQPFTGVKLREGESWHRLILGRGFLRQYTLTYIGSKGQVELR